MFHRILVLEIERYPQQKICSMLNFHDHEFMMIVITIYIKVNILITY